MSATLSNIDTEKINMGPCRVTFNGTELGRTQGSTNFRFTTEYRTETTEEDGDVLDIVVNHKGEVEIPIIYTDVDTLGIVVPWAKITTSTGGDKKLEVGSAIGQVMNEYAGELIIHPLAKDDADKSADITLKSAYPLPQTLDFAHSRDGKRMVNTLFKAQKDENGNYYTVGDPAIVAA